MVGSHPSAHIKCSLLNFSSAAAQLGKFYKKHAKFALNGANRTGLSTQFYSRVRLNKRLRSGFAIEFGKPSSTTFVAKLPLARCMQSTFIIGKAD